MDESLGALQFVYCNAAGELSQRLLLRWQEAGHYVKGFDEGRQTVLTFRKDRIREYLGNCRSLLKDPDGKPPPSLPRQPTATTRADFAQARAVSDAPQVLFTGFAAAQRAALEDKAIDAGLHIVKSVTTGLAFLVCGATAGPAKIEKARMQGVYIVSEPEFHLLIETGELPDAAVEALG